MQLCRSIFEHNRADVIKKMKGAGSFHAAG